MIEQIGQGVTFAAFYTASKQGKTGLTVTVDVYRGGTAVVTGGSATEIGGGLYAYSLAAGSVTAAANYYAIFKTSDATVDAQHLPALWTVGKAWVERVDAAVSTRATAAGVWSYATRSLTYEAPTNIIQGVSNGTLSIYRGDSLSASLVLGVDITGYVNAYLTIKHDAGEADSESVAQVAATGGLLVLNGVSNPGGAGGTLTVTGAGTGAMTLALDADVTAQLGSNEKFVWDLQVEYAASVRTYTGGTCAVTADVTRRTG